MGDVNTPGCESNENQFATQGGITNGAAWYEINLEYFCRT